MLCDGPLAASVSGNGVLDAGETAVARPLLVEVLPAALSQGVAKLCAMILLCISDMFALRMQDSSHERDGLDSIEEFHAAP